MRTISRAPIQVVFFLFLSLILVSISGALFAGVEDKAPRRHYATRPVANAAVRLQSSQAGFGSIPVGTATTQTVTFQFTVAATLSAVNILSSGAVGLDYTDGGGSTCVVNTSYAAGDSCMVNVSFNPTAPGMRAGAVTLFAQGNTLPLMTSYLNGIGQSSAVTIDPGTQTTIGTISSGTAYGSTVDGAGNVYVVDRVGNQVIELAAGSFTPSTVLTGLNSPTAVAIDGAGNLYVSDTQNSQVLMVPNESGALNAADKSIVSISGLGAPHGIAVDGSGNLYVADATNLVVVEVPAGGGTPVPVAQGLTAPHGVAVDAAGNVYVATNDAVTEYPFAGGTPVPLGSGYSNPRGLAVDAAGNIYVADAGHGTIVEVAAGNTSQSNFAVTGLTAPQSVSLDAADNLYVTDGGNVYEVNRAQPAPLTFPATNVGSASTSQTLTVSNAGNQQLTMSSVVVSPNFLQGISGGTDCSSNTNLPTGGQCLIAVAFTPMQSGTLPGSVILADNALNNPSSTQSVQLSGSGLQVAQTITFTTGAPASAIYNTSFVVTAAASSGLPVVYTSSGSCTNSGATYTMTSGTGTCTVITDQPGNSEYLPAPEVTQSVSASPASQTISFTTNAPTTAVYNSNFSVAASASTGLPVVYTSSGACTNAGATYTMTSGTGTCSVIANQAGNPNYSAALPVTQTVSGSLISQTVAFTTNAPTSASFNTSFTVAATASSNLSVAYTSSGVCTNSGATYTMTSGTGTCSVIANQAGNNNYSGAPQVAQTVGASLIAQTIMFTANAPASAAFNNNFAVAATASSGSPVVFTSVGACGNSGATYTMTAPTGTCSVIANQSGNTNYSAAPQVTQSTAATIAAQTITVTTKAPSSAAYNSSFTVLASASSGLPITYSSSGVCTNSGATYTITAATGTCTVIANQAGNANYTAAPKITELTTASKASPTVTLGGVPPTAPYQSTFTVTTTTNASTTAVITANGCLISGAIVTMNTGTGKCTVTAAWAADSLYLPASVSQSTTAQKLPSTLAWATPAAISYGTALSSVQLNATASSGSTALTGSLVYTPGTGNLPLAGNDTLSVNFTPTNNANYANATGSVTLLVNQLSTTTKITSTAPSAPILGQSVQVNFSVTASYSKPTQRVTVNSSTGETCSATLSSGTGFCSLTFLTAGLRTLTTTYSGDNNDLTSTSAGFPLSIISNVKIAPTVTFTGAPATAPYQSTFTVTATTNASSKAAMTTSGPCSISGTTVTMTTGTGTCTITANWAADTQYLAASASQSTTAQKLLSTLAWATPAAVNYGTALNSTELNAQATSGNTAVAGAFVYKPTSGSIPTAGNDTLSVAFTPTNAASYTSANGSVTLTVNQIGTTTRILSTTPSAPKAGQSVLVNLSVIAAYGKPTQSVTVNSSTGESCSATLSSGTGSCTLIFSTPGSRTLSANYNGDTNYLTSASAGFPLSVAANSGDFSLSISPSSLSVSPGSTLTTSPSATLTVTSLNNFVGSVALTVSGLPPGVTSTPSSPFNVNATIGYPFLTFLTFTTSSSVAPGSYLITVHGVSGSLNHSVSFTLNVNTPSDFNLLISPSGISVAPGATSSPVITSVAALGLYSGTVSVSIGGLPNGVTTSPASPFSVNAAGNQQITINVPGSVPNGNYPIVLTATDGTITHTASLMLAVGSVTFSQVFQHVIVIFQENRTPDNLFHGLPNADIANSGVNSLGNIVPLTISPLAINYDNDHSHSSFLLMYDHGKMDGADKIPGGCNSLGIPGCPPANPQFEYVDPNEVQPYFQLAEQYIFGDRMFQTNQGPSFPAHQFIIAGTSAPTATSNLFAADTATDGYGCGAASDSYAQLIDPSGNETQTMYPCFEHSTLMDLLDAQKITWRYYTPSVTSLWTGPYAIRHIYFGPDWANVIIPETTVLTDIANNRLPQVSWVIPNGNNSDHPGSENTGPSWVASIVNAIGNSQYWGSTVIIITWDDWGGWYDHVAPPIYNSYEYGFRVPLIIVSPYAKQPGYVSHVTHDFGSILRFTEEVFNLPSLGFADARADDFSDCFDLTQPPNGFQMIPAAMSAEFFLNDKRPPTPPDDDGDEK